MCDLKDSKKLDLFYYEYVCDLKFSLTHLPLYIQCIPVIKNKNSLSNYCLNVISVYKMMKRCKNSISKLSVCPNSKIENSNFEIRNMVENTKQWTFGMSEYFTDFLKNKEIIIQKDFEIYINKIIELSKLMHKETYPIWDRKWVNKLSDTSSDSDSNSD